METVKISKRLQTVAQQVVKGNRVADIGTDHGYLPIYLLQQGISPSVIAMDVRKGPLSKAEKNVAQYGVQEHVALRLSDGLEKLQAGEVDTVTICGMGGKLMAQILSNGIKCLEEGMQLLLSPQSELEEFRIFLKNHHICIVNEMMLKEENQYYVIMDCRYEERKGKAENRYGKILLEKKDPVLEELLLHELELNQRVTEKLEGLEPSDTVAKRRQDLKEEEAVILRALEYFR